MAVIFTPFYFEYASGLRLFHDGSDKGTVITQPSCPGSSLMKRAVFMVLTQITHQDRKKGDKGEEHSQEHAHHSL
jgi:hypothetical protein